MMLRVFKKQPHWINEAIRETQLQLMYGKYLTILKKLRDQKFTLRNKELEI